MRFAAAGISAVLACAPCMVAAAGLLPANLVPPAGLKPVLEANAVGVQIYRCKGEAGSYGDSGTWTLEAPRATLTDQRGEPVGRHYAGPTWEAADGSSITGKVSAKADAPDKGAIAWLLLTTESAGKPGRFASVQAVQRLYTSGGVAPPNACTQLDQKLEVPYKALYVFWAPQ